MVIKRITAANENLTAGRTREQAQAYWADSHGKLVSNRPNLEQYYHYFSLPEAYENDPKPTFIGISMFWHEDPLVVNAPSADRSWSPVGPDDRQLFDRTDRWPRDDQHAVIFGEEHVIVDGPSGGSMVNAIFMVSRLPGLDHRDFFEHWREVHGPLVSRLPGLRRYAQCHGALEAFRLANMTHDGWSELWFDDYPAFQRAVASPEWRAVEEDGATLFMPQKGIVIGREYIQKDDKWEPRDYGALSLTEAEMRDRLRREGYKALSEDPNAPALIQQAAAKGKLGVWTPEHLVTLDESRIDARPER
ncbi:MAG TPA: EthD domain-containing protein [Dehalococcoidia bacterium]|nr:EthD domain-containing protein [Dehalococcoidia bacterium]